MSARDLAAETPASDYVATDHTADEETLRDLFDMDEEDGNLEAVIPTCAGEWRHEDANVWRFWENPEWADDDEVQP